MDYNDVELQMDEGGKQTVFVTSVAVAFLLAWLKPAQ